MESYDYWYNNLNKWVDAFSVENPQQKRKSWKDFMDALGKRNICLAPWCDSVDCECAVKDRSKEEKVLDERCRANP